MTYNRKTRHDVESLRKRAKELELSAGARLRLSWFMFALDHSGNISVTCAHFGISRSTYHRWADRFDPEDPRSLESHSKRPHRTRSAETPDAVIALIRAYRTAHPMMNKNVIAARLKEEHDYDISPSSVGRVIARHGFYFGNSASHRTKRAAFERDHAIDETSTSFLSRPESDLGFYGS